MAAKLAKIDENTPYLDSIPLHENCFAWPLINPKICPGAQCEFAVSELHALVGHTLDDVHPDEDHVFYGLSGRAEAIVDGESYIVEPGTVLWVSKGSVHNFTPMGGETFRYIVVTAPPRAMWS